MADWIEKLSALMKDKSIRTRMGQSARQTVLSFDLGAIGPQLVSIIKNAVAVS